MTRYVARITVARGKASVRICRKQRRALGRYSRADVYVNGVKLEHGAIVWAAWATIPVTMMDFLNRFGFHPPRAIVIDQVS